MISVYIMIGYMVLLLGLGVFSSLAFRGTAKDYFTASQSIGPFILLMSIFGTTMTAFAMVGSTSEAYHMGIGVYGMMASWSGLVHAAVFFLIGIKLWGYGKRYGYVTQVQYFRDRFESNFIGILLFPILVGLVIPYLLTGLLGASSVVRAMTIGAFPNAFPETNGGIPGWLTGLVISSVVLFYIFYGGLRGAAWANTFQTIVFMVFGVIAYVVIADKLGGAEEASMRVASMHPHLLDRGEEIRPLHFLTYAFIPLSVGMFPHLFQHWLTAKSAKAFRLTVIAHPLCIMIVWAPCVLLGIWASSAIMPDGSLVVPENAAPNSQLGLMINKLTTPVLGGFLGAGVLAAIMSSLDSQFVCLGTMFTNDVIIHHFGENKFTDRQRVLMARGFIILVVAITYLLSLAEPRAVFSLGVWTFTGFSSLFPVVFAAVYWKRVTKAGAIASVLVTIAVWLVLFSMSDFGKKGEETLLPYGIMPVVPTIAASMITLVAVSLMTKPPSEATIRKFFGK